MLLASSILLLATLTSAQVSNCNNSTQYSVKCGEGNKTDVSVRPSADGVPGRYEVTHCASPAATATKWTLTLKTRAEPPARCSYEVQRARRTGSAHSNVVEDLQYDHLNCSHVCFTRSLDLMFGGCYMLASMLEGARGTSRPRVVYYYADNNLTEADYANNSQYALPFDNGTFVSITWYLGRIPVTDYAVEVCDDEECRGGCARPAGPPAGGAGRCGPPAGRVRERKRELYGR